MASNMLRFCGCDQGSPTESISAGKSKPHKTSNGTSQRHPAAEIHCAHFSNLLHARAVGTKFNLRVALCLQQQRPCQKGRSCSSKGRRLEQQALQYLRVPPRLFDSFALNTHTKSGTYEQVRRKMNNRTGWNGSNTGKTWARTPPGRSKRTFIECTCACSSKDPNGCKDVRVCPPSPRQTGGLALSKAGWASAKSLTTINGTSQSMSTSRNDRPPTRKGNHPFMGAPYRACQRHEPPQSAKMLSWDFLIRMLIRAAPLKAFAGRGGNSSSARNDQCLRTKSRANDFPAVPGAPATTGSSWSAALPGHGGCHPASSAPA